MSEQDKLLEIVIVCNGGCGKTTKGMTWDTREGEFEQVDESGVPKWTCPDCLEQNKLSLTEEEISDIEDEIYEENIGTCELIKAGAEAQLAKAKPHYEQRTAEAIRLLEKVVPKDKDKMIEWAVKSQDSVYTNAGAAYRILKGD